MKKTLLLLTACTIISGAIITSCGTSAQKTEDAQAKVENAQNNVTEANKNLNKANEEYVVDIEKYRKEADEKAAANDKIIADLKTRIDMQKKEVKEDYKKRVAELELKNAEMKKKMHDYKAQGKENWDNFKTDFNHSTDDLGKAFTDLTAGKSK